METVRVIYEHGITVGKIGDEWYLLNKNGGGSVRIEQPTITSDLYNVRPIIVTQRFEEDREIDLLLWKTKPEPFGLKISDLYQLAIRLNMPIYNSANVIYLLQSVEYHCIQLCKHYASICQRYTSMHFSGIADLNESNIAIFQGEPEPYFEFDALTTALRRTYDSCRFLIFKYFTLENEAIPLQFYKTLPKCKKWMPPDVYQRLEYSWNNYGEELTEYRDCIQHYSPIDFGLSSLYMEKLDGDVWSVRVLVPDNPSAKGKAKFTWSKKRDALTYGWNVANEVLDIVTIIMNAIATKQGIQLKDTDDFEQK